MLNYTPPSSNPVEEGLDTKKNSRIQYGCIKNICRPYCHFVASAESKVRVLHITDKNLSLY